MSNRLFFYTIKVITSQKNLLLNTLLKAKISVFNLKIESNAITFSIKIKDMRKTFAILKNMCYNYSVCDKRTPKTLTLSLAKRAGFVVSFMLSLISVFFCSRLLVGVRVLVDDVSIKEQISSIEQISNFSPCFSSEIDLKLLRENICSISSVAECSIKVKGNYLEVSILPSVKVEERNPVYSSYVSKYDAMITEIIAHKGTPLVKVGQRVFENTPLISPSAFNENGEEILNTGIQGKVYGEVVFTKSFEIDCKRKEKVKSGKRIIYTSLALHKVILPSPYEFFERQTESALFNIFLPVYYTKTTYEELVERVVEVNIEEFCQNALYELAVEKGVVGQTQSYSYEEKDGKYKISLYLKTTMEIGFGE